MLTFKRLIKVLSSALVVGISVVLIDSRAAGAEQAWTSPHLTIEKFASWSEFLDVLNQPRIDMLIRNDGSEGIGSFSFKCRLFLLDRAPPVFEGAWSTDLDHVIRPGESQTVKLTPNMFSEVGEVIQHHYDNAAWSCYVSRVLTATGTTVSFEPGQQPTDGPPFGVSYVPVPDAMAPLLKVEPGTGLWVLRVQAGSTAEAVGLKQGDAILAVDGHELRSIPDLPNALRTVRVSGHLAHLSIVRAGKRLELEGALPVPASGQAPIAHIEDPPKGQAR